jgi:hypothetical protein
MEFDVKTATEILTNPKHEHYEASRRPGEVYNAVMRAFETAHPGEQTLGDGNNLPVHLDQAMNAEAAKLGLTQPVPPTTPEATPPEAPAEPAKEWSQADSETYLRMQLKQEGRDYDTVIKETTRGVEAIFEGEDVDLITRFLGRAGNDPEFVLLARRTVDRLRAKGAI